jgi:hypothetical protein
MKGRAEQQLKGLEATKKKEKNQEIKKIGQSEN